MNYQSRIIISWIILAFIIFIYWRYVKNSTKIILRYILVLLGLATAIWLVGGLHNFFIFLCIGVIGISIIFAVIWFFK
jgi:hypothetical protein